MPPGDSRSPGSLIVAGVSILTGGFVGTTLAAIAVITAGWDHQLSMRLVDIKLSIQAVLLDMVLCGGTGPGFHTVIIVIALVLWGGMHRLCGGRPSP